MAICDADAAALRAKHTPLSLGPPADVYHIGCTDPAANDDTRDQVRSYARA